MNPWGHCSLLSNNSDSHWWQNIMAWYLIHADLPTSIFSFIKNIHLATARNEHSNGFPRKQIFSAQKTYNVKGNLMLTKALIHITIILQQADDEKKH